MQLSNQHDMIKRTLYYWSRLFLDQLPKGKTYRRLLLSTFVISPCSQSQRIIIVRTIYMKIVH